MNLCTECMSFYTQPGTCNCYANEGQPAWLPLAPPYLPPSTAPWPDPWTGPQDPWTGPQDPYFPPGSVPMTWSGNTDDLTVEIVCAS